MSRRSFNAVGPRPYWSVLVACAVGLSIQLTARPSVLAVSRQSREAQVVVGAVSGTVRDAETDLPIAGALVALSGGVGVPGAAVMTDTQGRFVFQSVRPGPYTVSAQKSGYLDGVIGETEAIVEPFALRSGVNGVKRLVLAQQQWVDDAVVRLHRSGSVSGQVVDEDLRPVAGRPIRVLAMPDSREEPVRLAGASLTDDDGRFTVGRLIRGRYVVVILPFLSDGGPSLASDRKAYPLVCSDGSESISSASAISVDYGRHIDLLSIQIRPRPVRRIAGRVTASVQLPDGLELSLATAGEFARVSSSQLRIAKVTKDGEFEFLNVPAGRYTIQFASLPIEPSVGTQLAGGPLAWRLPIVGPEVSQVSVWGQGEVDVSDKDAVGVSLALPPLLRVTGRVSRDERSPDISFPRMLSLVPDGLTSGSLRTAMLAEDGTFQVDGIVPGSYLVDVAGSVSSVSTPSGRVGEKLVVQEDLADLRIVLTRGLQLAGRVRASDLSAIGQTSVLFFPDSVTQWAEPLRRENRTGRVSVKSDGSFETLAHVPPGRYRVVAVPDALVIGRPNDTLRRLLAPHSIVAELRPDSRVHLDLPLLKLLPR